MLKVYILKKIVSNSQDLIEKVKNLDPYFAESDSNAILQECILIFK